MRKPRKWRNFARIVELGLLALGVSSACNSSPSDDAARTWPSVGAGTTGANGTAATGAFGGTTGSGSGEGSSSGSTTGSGATAGADTGEAGFVASDAGSTAIPPGDAAWPSPPGADDAGSAAGDSSIEPPSPDVVPPAGTVDIEPPQAADCLTNVGPGDLVIRNCGDGITFYISVPEQCMTKACGLIFDVHGLAMSRAVQEQGTGLAALGKRESYIVVQPEATGLSWDTAGAQDDTIIKVFHLAMDVWNVEPRRAHFTGFSMGGAMTYRMRCKLADVLASTAPTAISASACPAGTPPVDNIWIQGQHDALVSPARVRQTLGEVVAAYGLVEDSVVASTPGYEWTRYTNADGMVFELLHHDYSGLLDGHCFIGGAGWIACNDRTDLKDGEVVMDFFKAHPRRVPLGTP